MKQRFWAIYTQLLFRYCKAFGHRPVNYPGEGPYCTRCGEKVL